MSNSVGARVSVNIVGAGVCGLSVASAIKATYGDEVTVTITADKFYSETTSFAAGGLWEPHLLGDTPHELVLRWSERTFLHYQKLYFSEDAESAGVQHIKVQNLFSDDDNDGQIAPTPIWAAIEGLEFSCPGPGQLAAMGYPPTYTHAHSFNSYVADPKFFLAYMTENLKQSGVTFEKKNISHIREQLDEKGERGERKYDIIINCSGLGAHTTENDSSMFPIRGQVLRVKAPWIKSSCTFGSSYVIPNVNSLVVGGTGQINDWNTAVSSSDSKKIIEGVCEIFPSLRHAEVLETNVGLRPCRPSVRLDSELVPASASISSPHEQLLVRCYGLGGSGYTLAPGLALDVVEKHICPYVNSTLSRCGANALRLKNIARL